MEKKSKTPAILIAYDVHPPRGDTQDRLNAAIRTLGIWWHHLETIWIVRSGYTPLEIREKLKCMIGSEDQLLVVDISGDAASWTGINDFGDKWLKANVAAPAEGSDEFEKSRAKNRA